MLLRSASTSFLNSWNKTHIKANLLESELAHCQQQRKKPGTNKPFLILTASLSPISGRMKRTVSDSDLVQLSRCKVGSFEEFQNGVSMDKERGIEFSDGVVCGVGSGGGGGGGGGGSGCGGCGGSIHGFGGGSGSVDEYYLKMIEANPGNALILSNYARFLKEIREDSIKAEEYCERAIVENPDDGTVLSMYADLLWKNQRDAEQAESYFNQAVNTAPNDCYVMASYAHFLWDVEDEKIEDGEGMNVVEASSPIISRGECLAAPS